MKTDDEQDRQAATDLLDAWMAGGLRFLLPELWAFEVGNVLGRKAPQKAPEIMEILLDYRFPERKADREVVHRTLALMEHYGVTFYDAAYHAVALVAGGALVTADEAYHRKTQNAGGIVLLKEWRG